jgi:hypothetical protein
LWHLENCLPFAISTFFLQILSPILLADFALSLCIFDDKIIFAISSTHYLNEITCEEAINVNPILHLASGFKNVLKN